LTPFPHPFSPQVLHCQGLDELAPIGPATIATVRPSGVEMSILDPSELGFPPCTISDLKGGDRVSNARSLRQVLAGELPGPIADTVALNAGAGLYVAGVAGSIREGCEMAKAAIQAGTPIQTLDKWVKCSQAAA
jgi:anthranilate phosphoribosyltransferase